MYSEKNASDFRYEARVALSGKWWLAVGTTFIASLLGLSTISSSVSVNSPNMENIENPIVLLIYLLVLGICTVITIANFVLAGPITLGYIKFTMKAHDKEKSHFKDIFSQFRRFGEGFCVYALRLLYMYLWILAAVAIMMIVGIPVMLLFKRFGFILFYAITIAAIIFVLYKMYGYSLAPYIMYSNPGIGARNAIKLSVALMDGNKWRFFCLQFSFIGWSLLINGPILIAVFVSPVLVLLTCPLLIGNLWLKTYTEFAYTAFYRQIISERKGILPSDKNDNSDNNDFMNKLQDSESIVEKPRWNY